MSGDLSSSQRPSGASIPLLLFCACAAFSIAARLPCSRHASACGHPEPVHLAREFLAELFKQISSEELLLQRVQDARFDFVSSDREMVAADALIRGADQRRLLPLRDGRHRSAIESSEELDQRR